MDELTQMKTVANGGIMFVSISDKDEKEHEKNPGYVYYYHTNNHTLTGNLYSSVSLAHYESSRTIVSSLYRDDGGDAYVSVGKNYDEAHDVDVCNGGYLRINEQTVSGIDIRSGGYVFFDRGSGSDIRVHSDGVLSFGLGTGSGIEVMSGGAIYGSVNSIYVHSGAITNGRYNNITIEAGGYVNGSDSGFVNLANADVTFDYIAGNSASIQNRTLSDFKCEGRLGINSNAVVSGGEITEVAVWNVNNGGRIEQSFDVTEAGTLNINGGGVARIWSASTVAGESASLVNSGTIEFLVASAALGGEALLNDYTMVGGNGRYAITVSGDERTGEYRLIGNAVAFNKNVTISVENTDFSGTFQWNGSGYNYVQLGDSFYTLHIEAESEDLILTKRKPLSITITPENFGQLYFAEKDGSTCFAMNYTFSVDITYFGGLPDGTYTYKAKLNGCDGEVDFTFTVTDGVFSYQSDKMCYSGNVTQNSDGSETWRLEHAVDVFYINQFDSESVELMYGSSENASTEALCSNETIRAVPCTGMYTDVNKHYGIISFNPISFSYIVIKELTIISK